jgi:hypothetical protein
MPLPKYHLYIEQQNPKEKPNIRFNLTQEETVRLFVKPFLEEKPFFFCGRLLNPSKIQTVFIFSSQDDASKLVLPNREEVTNHPDKKFVIDYIKRGKVKGVEICTDKFLPLTKQTDHLQKL